MILIKQVLWKDLMKVFQFLKIAGKDFPDPYFRVTDKKIDHIRIFTRLIKHLFLNSFQKLTNYSTVMWLAEDCDGVKGVAVVGIRNGKALLHDIYSRDFRRRGIGSELLKVVIDFCARRNYVLGLYVNNNNTSAINFYKKNGFKIIGSNNDSIYMEL
jgi:GNAT superfamily N-acetyltransferase